MAKTLANGRSHSPWRKGILIPLWAVQLTLLSTAIVLLSLGIEINVKANIYIPKWTIINLGVAVLVLFITGTEIIIFANRTLRPIYFVYTSIAKEVLWTVPLVFNILALVIQHGWGKWLYAVIGIGLNTALYFSFLVQMIHSSEIYRSSRNYTRELTPERMSMKSIPSIITTTPESGASAEMQPLYYESYRGAAPVLPEVRITEASPISTPRKSLESERPPLQVLSSNTIPVRYASISQKMGPKYQLSTYPEVESLYDDGRSLGEGDERVEKVVDTEVEAASYRTLITTSQYGEITRGFSVRSQESTYERQYP